MEHLGLKDTPHSSKGSALVGVTKSFSNVYEIKPPTYENVDTPLDIVERFVSFDLGNSLKKNPIKI